jgi:hypothetical protein
MPTGWHPTSLMSIRGTTERPTPRRPRERAVPANAWAEFSTPTAQLNVDKQPDGYRIELIDRSGK